MSKNEKTKDWKKFHEENQENDNPRPLDTEESSSEEPSLGHLSYEELEKSLTLAEQKAHENWERSVRATAELDNVRKRAQEEVNKTIRYGLQNFISSLLPVLDSIEQALQLARQGEDTAMCEGLELTMKLFLDVLAKQDVTQIDPLGAVFNPQEHEAMSMQEQAGTPPNTVIIVFQKGYKLNDRVIRPARVIVSKA